MIGVLLIVGCVPLIALCGLVRTGRRRLAVHGFVILAWRFLSGHPWHGKPVTDAGWLRPGKRALTRTGHASRFHHRPRWQRAAWRTGGTLAIILAAYGLIIDRSITLAALAAAAAALLVLGVLRAWRAVRRRRHRRTWIDPLHVALAPLAGIPLPNPPKSWLAVDPDRSRAVLSLPPGYNEDAKQRDKLAATAAAKLGLEQPEIRWQLAGPEPKLTLVRSEPPPERVTLADIRDAVDRAPRDTLVLGLGKRNAPVAVSLHGDSPHVGASMGSGAGKSTLARAITAQMLHKGAIGLFLDIKLISHMWARGLPNTAYADTPEAIHAALIWLAYELDRRNQVAKASADVEGNVLALVGPRLIIVCEELNMTMNRLRGYWKDSGAAGRSPAISALEDVAFAGRQVEMNMLMIGQMLSAKATGSGEARENVGVRLMARYTERAWKMLVPEHPMPPASDTLGRVQVIASGQVRETQIAFMTGAQARELATSGTVAPLPAGMPGASLAPVGTGALLPFTGGPDQPMEQFPTVSGPPPVSLSEAVSIGILTGQLAGIRTARHRDPSFPEPVGKRGLAHIYDPEELDAWNRARR